MTWTNQWLASSMTSSDLISLSTSKCLVSIKSTWESAKPKNRLTTKNASVSKKKPRPIQSPLRKASHLIHQCLKTGQLKSKTTQTRSVSNRWHPSCSRWQELLNSLSTRNLGFNWCQSLCTFGTHLRMTWRTLWSCVWCLKLGTLWLSWLSAACISLSSLKEEAN